ncbi:putative acyl-CoA desaturase [Rosa chinensis]|uniref:Putative acyl-CoA desaturase n=1 Tax=Rosa chinensis TaxID=74649 RepID=A0A2P6S1I3_ROSCH|nr:putative acyl-CoA desaturase [Rosa chinensis]
MQAQCFRTPWTAIDILNMIVPSAIHGLALLAPFHFNWFAIRIALVLLHVTSLSVTLSYHRNLAHRSFKLPRWLEYSFAYCGVLSLQGSLIEWVSTHRIHHQFTDTSIDPHTPFKGFWYSHIGWIVAYHSRFATDEAKLLNNVRDLKKQWYYRFLHYT